MFDPEQPRENVNLEMIDQPKGDSVSEPERQVIRVMMPLAGLGLLIVFIALFLLLWPTPQSDHIQTTLHALRIIKPQETGATPATFILDLSIYVIVLAGLWFLVRALRRGTRSALVGLMGVGVLGLAYASGMALYTGPMVSICGFSLILFAGMLAWAATSSEPIDEPLDPGQDLRTDRDIDNDHQDESEPARRTGTHASYFVA